MINKLICYFKGHYWNRARGGHYRIGGMDKDYHFVDCGRCGLRRNLI